MTEEKIRKLLFVAVLALLAAVSFLVVADWAASPDSHTATLASLSDNTETVLKLSGASALASTAITFIPGDAATPIAGKLADFTEYFLLILCVLYAEKYLVTILGAAVFRILFPLAFALLGVSLWWKPQALRALAIKLIAVGAAVFLVIPASVRISDMISRSYEASIQATVDSAEELTEKTSGLAEADGDKGLIASVLDRIRETAGTLTDKAADTLNRFLETLAVMIVTSCLIPILVLLFFLWLIRQLTGVDLAARFRLRGEKRRGSAPAGQP